MQIKDLLSSLCSASKNASSHTTLIESNTRLNWDHGKIAPDPSLRLQHYSSAFGLMQIPDYLAIFARSFAIENSVIERAEHYSNLIYPHLNVRN